MGVLIFMTRNVLSELDIITSEIIDVGYRYLSDGSQKAYGKLTRETYMKVINYVRGGSWTDNDTARFVVQNFHIGQANLAEAYNQMFPSKSPKADSTIRTQFQKVNRYLQNVFPTTLVESFTNEDEEKLKALSSLIDALYLNDQRIESSLGEQLISLLQGIPLGYRKYKVEECLKELETLKKLSCSHAGDLIGACDQNKLAYTYHVLTRPSVIKGELNEARLSFIKAFVGMDVHYTTSFEERGSLHTESVTTSEALPTESVTTSEAPTIGVEGSVTYERESLSHKGSTSEFAIGGYECINPIDIIKDYAEGGVVNEDDFINPEVTDCIRSIITQNGIMEQLSRFTKDEVAYALSVIGKGDLEFIDAFEEGRTVRYDNRLGSVTLMEGVKAQIENCIESVVTPSDQVPASVLLTIADYTPSVMKERLSSIKAEDLACAYEKLCDENHQLVSMIHKMSGQALADYEAERLALKKWYIQQNY